MPAIFEDSLKKDISSGEFANGYILYGEDAYLKKHYSYKIAEKTAGLDSVFDLQNFSGNCNLQQVYDAVLQFPMMCERKCVILTDFDFEKSDKNDFERLLGLIGEINSSGVFILRFDSVEFDDKRSSKAKKLIAAMEKHGGKAVKLDHRKPAELSKMLSEGAFKRKCRMDSATAKYLIENVGSDINILKNELDKLCLFVGSGVIEKATVDRVCVKTVESNIFNLNEKIFSCNTAAALKMLDDFFFMRIEPMVIFYTVSGAYTDMYRMSAAAKCGMNSSDVAHKFGYGVKKFLLDRAAVNLKKFDGKKLPLSFDVLLETERKLKAFGGNERIILEEMIVKLCFIIAKGKAV